MRSLSYAMDDGMVPAFAMFSDWYHGWLDQDANGSCPKQDKVAKKDLVSDKRIVTSISNISWGEIGTTTQKKVG